MKRPAVALQIAALGAGLVLWLKKIKAFKDLWMQEGINLNLLLILGIG